VAGSWIAAIGLLMLTIYLKPVLPALASLAKACASDAYMQTAIHTIQIHGGIGFTWDNDTHLWFKRAKSSEVFLGDPAWHRELMMRAWGV
jgi:alkylation response protein AidB-like acyl-CoA dehydrogenase